MAAFERRAQQENLTNNITLLEQLGKVGVWRYEASTGELRLSPGAAALLGQPSNCKISGDALCSLAVPADRTLLGKMLAGRLAEVEVRLERDPASGVLFVLNPADRTSGIVSDMGIVASLRTELEFTHRRYAHFEWMSYEWLWETDPDLRITYMSPSIEKILDIPPAFYIGKTRRDLLSDKNPSLEMEMHLAWLDRHEPFQDFRYWHAGPDGKELYLSVTGEPVHDREGTFIGYRGTGRDLTGQQQIREALLQVNRQLNAANKAKSDAMGSLKEANALLEERNRDMEQAQEEIRYSALHDALTGLGNRRRMDEELEQAIERGRREGVLVGALHLDLDRFKQINDTLGHAAGDAVLVHVAKVLQATAAGSDLIARVGGDEFVIVTTGRECETLVDMAKRIIATLTRPFDYEGRQCWYGASVGISLTWGEVDARQLLAKADLALYRAKREGRGRVEVFSDDMQHEMSRLQEISAGIQAGLDRSEFVPWYQPQVSAADFSICGLEALARWHPPDGSIRSPAEFLPVAEELNKVQAIDRKILEAALQDLAYWDDLGLAVSRLSVNVSARRLVEPDLVESVKALAPPRGRLAFELLESVFLDELEQVAAWNIDSLKEMGVEIELDDFGSGHASIISLVRLGPDAIKIDRRMAAGINDDPSRRNLAAAIIGIGKTLGVTVVAEGVESLEQAVMLSELGCDRLQGFYFSKPMAAEHVPEFLRTWSDPRAGGLAQAG